MTQLSPPTIDGQKVDRDALAQAIIDLENGSVAPIADPQLAYELGNYVKPLGRQNLAYINFGDNGIPISDISRQETHQQLGVCPSW